MPATPPPSLSPLPAAPDRGDRATFSSRATAMFTALKDVFVGQINAITSNVYSNAQSAETAATAAGNSATSAGTSATNAASSATAAGTSATSAGTSATNAASSASAAATSANNASTSAAAAAASAVDAQGYVASVNAAATKATPVDADVLGFLDSAASLGLKKFTFANLRAWIAALGGAGIANTPSGNISSTTVQGAINELDTEKVSTSVGQLGGMRNKIINGNFDVWQRGTSFSGAAAVFTADRWFAPGAAGQAVTRVADHPTAGSAGFCIQVANTSGAEWLQQRIESNNLRDLVGKTVTASVWVKNIVAFGPGASLAVVRANAIDDWAATTDVGTSAPTASTSWTQLTHTFTMTAAMANGLMLRVITAGGGSGAATVRISMAQLEVGPAATSFEHRDYGLELALCQRYLPAVVGGDTTAVGIGTFRTATQLYVACHFPVEARVKPTGVTVTSAAILTAESGAGAFASSAIVATSVQSAKCGILSVTVAGATAGQAALVYFNGNAGASGSILFTGCEL